MGEFDYKQNPKTPEYRDNYEQIFGQRCPKHPSEKLDAFGMCERCNELHWEKVLESQGVSDDRKR